MIIYKKIIATCLIFVFVFTLHVKPTHAGLEALLLYHARNVAIFTTDVFGYVGQGTYLGSIGIGSIGGGIQLYGSQIIEGSRYYPVVFPKELGLSFQTFGSKLLAIAKPIGFISYGFLAVELLTVIFDEPSPLSQAIAEEQKNYSKCMDALMIAKGYITIKNENISLYNKYKSQKKLVSNATQVASIRTNIIKETKAMEDLIKSKKTDATTLGKIEKIRQSIISQTLLIVDAEYAVAKKETETNCKNYCSAVNNLTEVISAQEGMRKYFESSLTNFKKEINKTTFVTSNGKTYEMGIPQTVARGGTNSIKSEPVCFTTACKAVSKSPQLGTEYRPYSAAFTKEWLKKLNDTISTKYTDQLSKLIKSRNNAKDGSAERVVANYNVNRNKLIANHLLRDMSVIMDYGRAFFAPQTVYDEIYPEAKKKIDAYIKANPKANRKAVEDAYLTWFKQTYFLNYYGKKATPGSNYDLGDYQQTTWNNLMNVTWAPAKSTKNAFSLAQMGTYDPDKQFTLCSFAPMKVASASKTTEWWNYLKAQVIDAWSNFWSSWKTSE